MRIIYLSLIFGAMFIYIISITMSGVENQMNNINAQQQKILKQLRGRK